MATRQFSTDQFAGGEKDMVFSKKSDADFDAGWGESDPGIPSGGSTGQVLAKKTNTDYDTEWVTPEAGGETGPKIANVVLSNLAPSEGITQFGVDVKVEAISPYKSFCHDVLWIGDSDYGGASIGYQDDQWNATAVCYDQENGLWDLKPWDDSRESGFITWMLQNPPAITGFSNKSSAFTADGYTVTQLRLSLENAVLRWDGESESATLILANNDIYLWEEFEESGDERTLVVSTALIDNVGDGAYFTVDVEIMTEE